MPRSGVNGTYTLPGAQKTQQPLTPIPSAVNNQGWEDVEQTFNTIQPIAYGGTGGGTILDAQDNLGITNKLNKDGSNATARTKWRLRAIGEIIYVDTSLTGVEIPPADAGFIELTAGLDGSGQYNEGKLTGEAISGSGATLTATAVIDDAASPMDGQTIPLINTEERVTYAGERSKAGDVFNDQMQVLTGAFRLQHASASPGNDQGVFTTENLASGSRGTGGTNVGMQVDFNSADSPDARTGDRTRAKGQFLVAFLKYKDVA